MLPEALHAAYGFVIWGLSNQVRDFNYKQFNRSAADEIRNAPNKIKNRAERVAFAQNLFRKNLQRNELMYQHLPAAVGLIALGLAGVTYFYGDNLSAITLGAIAVPHLIESYVNYRKAQNIIR